MNTLQEYGQCWNTSKITAHSYAPFYEAILAPIRYDSIKLLEIGIHWGHSLLMWLDYLPSAHIYGIDTSDFIKFTSPRMTTYNCPAHDPRVGTLFQPESLDIILDDASHVPEQQEAAYRYLWPALKRGGWFIIEDLIGPEQIRRWSHLPDFRFHQGQQGPDDIIVAFRKPL